MSDQLPPAGWYAAPHANNEQRYWDGTQWLETTPEPVSGDHSATALYPAAAALPTDGPDQSAPKKSRKGWIIGGSIAAGIILIGGVGSALGLGSSSPESKPQTTVTPWNPPESTQPVEDPVVMVIVPDVVGMTIEEALPDLYQRGMVAPDISTFADPLATIVSTHPSAGDKVEHGTEITLTVEESPPVQEQPKFSLSQQNAISKAQSYLSFTGFSHSGLIEQLEYEGFSVEDATLGADNSGADWNAECAEKATSYLELTAFSRDGLYDQLAYDGFTSEQIEFGLAAVGY